MEAPDAPIIKLNEEHGLLDITQSRHHFHVGEVVTVIPNHVCTSGEYARRNPDAAPGRGRGLLEDRRAGEDSLTLHCESARRSFWNLLLLPTWGSGWLATGAFIIRGEMGEGVETV